MEIQTQRQGPVILASLQGRFDAVGSREVEAAFTSSSQENNQYLLIDMMRVDYLSSAGLRVILMLHKRFRQLGGSVAITGLQPYCRNVLEMVGFTSAFPIFESKQEAIDFLNGMIQEQSLLAHWDQLETTTLDCGTFRFISQNQDSHSVVEVLGHVNNVLYSRITPNHLSSKNFFTTEYSIGLGGLGDRMDDYFPLMGEMITIGGTMVWLPTDGNDIPDFLIPQKDTGQVTLRTGFNVSITGGFNELIEFDSASPEGVTLENLYQALYHLARTRRSDYRGVLGIALRAQMPAVYGSGIKRSPIQDFAPENGEMIIHSSNSAQWFDFDQTPRHQNVTGLICGLGVDLSADLSQYNQEELQSVFYLHPTQLQERRVLLHNHVVIFNPLPFPERSANFVREIKQVVEQGDFIDMRHLLDISTVGKALISIGYIQEFRRDPHGYRER